MSIWHLLGKGVLQNAGAISMEEAQAKADHEYETFKKEAQSRYISDFDRVVKQLEQKQPARKKKKITLNVMKDTDAGKNLISMKNTDELFEKARK